MSQGNQTTLISNEVGLPSSIVIEMPSGTKTTIVASDGALTDSIVIENWPQGAPAPHVTVVECEPEPKPSESGERRKVTIPPIAELDLFEVVSHLKTLGIDYVRVEYHSDCETGLPRLKAYFATPISVASAISQEIEAYFSNVLRSRHPECFARAASAEGWFSWLIEPEQIKHRHERHGTQPETFIRYGL